MDVVIERCVGLDLGKKLVVACVIIPSPDGRPHKQVRSFGTMTADLLALGDWLAQQGVTHAAMESTGVYWKPVYNLLESAFALLLVNAQHIQTVPGRKTDVRDCEWIADLLRHGLLQPSFVPDRPQRELRELTRYRTSLVAARRGKMKAAVAVGHSILVIAYYLLGHPDQPFYELGSNHFDQRDQQAVERRAVRRLERLGYKVTLEPTAA